MSESANIFKNMPIFKETYGTTTHLKDYKRPGKEAKFSNLKIKLKKYKEKKSIK